MPRSTERPYGLSLLRGSSFEKCGLLVVCGGRIGVVPVRNSAEDPRETYDMSREDMMKAIGELPPGDEVIGIIHTHLPHHPPHPSDADIESARVNKYFLHAVYKPSTGELTWYDGDGVIE